MIERLNILLENKVIDEAIFNDVLKIHEGLMTDEELLDSDSYTTAITHLAMALQRINKDEIVDEMDEEILNQLIENENYQCAKDLTDKVVKQLSIEVPSSEQQYLLLHFLNLFNKKGEDV